jgi:DNA-binding YbaB/EbfC family protein
MKDIGGLMRQAQAMQAKMQDAQARLAQTVVEGQAGGGLVKLSINGGGAMVALTIAPDLMEPGEAETLQDLVLAAHQDAKARMDAESERVMKEAMGPLAGMAGGMPGFPGLR